MGQITAIDLMASPSHKSFELYVKAAQDETQFAENFKRETAMVFSKTTSGVTSPIPKSAI
jgi:hypothetical protein